MTTDWQFLTFCCVSGHLANILQEAHVPIISDAVCNAPDYYDNQITTTMFCAGYEKGGTDACQVRLGLFWCPMLVFLHPLIFMFANVCLFHVCLLMDCPARSTCDLRETAAVLLWQRTVYLRPVAIVCSEWWAGERAAPWPRNPASTPKCPDFFPGYLQPWGWETPFVLCLFSTEPGKILPLQMCFCSRQQNYHNLPGVHKLARPWNQTRASEQTLQRTWGTFWWQRK